MNFESNDLQNNIKSKNDELSELSELNKEQSIPKQINPNENNSNIEKSNNNENKELQINYGKYKILKYDKNNEPFLVIGPDYIYFIIIIFLNILIIIFFAILQYCYSKLIVRIFGLILSFIQLFIYIYCTLKNPGFPKKTLQDPSLLNQKEGYFRRCRECGIIVDLRKFPGHCYKCKFCCEGFDHHCAWTTKCIGSGNSKLFKCFLCSFFILIVYFGISALWFEPSRNKCRIDFF